MEIYIYDGTSNADIRTIPVNTRSVLTQARKLPILQIFLLKYINFFYWYYQVC
jgi:hypothetical protein